jgi:hypothetical protein
VKLWLDECVPPSSGTAGTKRGYDTVSNRDRGMLGVKDHELFPAVVDEDRVLVTNNAADFEALCVEHGLHCGLIVLPQPPSIDAAEGQLDDALAYVENRAKSAGEAPRDWMVNRVVELYSDGTLSHRPLPPA